MTEVENVLIQIARDASVKRLESHSGIGDLESIDMESGYNRKVHANWMSIILVSGLDVRITFKLYFNCIDVKEVVQKSMGTAVDDVTNEFTMDFIKEFCNLTAGMIQKNLATQGFHVGISLLMVTRGFDDIFYEPSSSGEVSDLWKIKIAGVSIICSATLNVINAKNLELLTLNDVAEEEDDGEIDFL